MSKPIKLGPNQWRVQISAGKDPATGKRHRPSAIVHGTYKDALAKQRDMEAARDAGRLRVSASQRTLADWYEEFMAIKKGNISPITYDWYRYMWIRLNDVLGKKRLVDINRRHVIFYLDSLRSCKQLGKQKTAKGIKPLSDTSIVGHFSFLRLLLQHAVYREYIPFNPAKDTIEAPRRNASCADSLTLDEARKLCVAVQKEPLLIRLLVLLSLHTGLRRGEIIGLQWQDINEQDGVIRVERSAIRSSGEQITKLPKSEKGLRSVWPDSSIFTILREWRDQFTDVHTTDYVFRWPDSGKRIDLNFPTKAIPAFFIRHNIRRLRCHDMRHTYVSLMLQAGMSIAEVQTMAGHAHQSTTLNVYNHLTTVPQERAKTAITGLLAQKTAPTSANQEDFTHEIT